MRSVVVLDFNQESEMAGENQTPAALWRGLLAGASLRHGNVATWINGSIVRLEASGSRPLATGWRSSKPSHSRQCGNCSIVVAA